MTIDRIRRRVAWTIKDPRLMADIASVLLKGEVSERDVFIPSGDKMRVLLPDRISARLCVEQRYEPEVTSFMEATLRRGDKVIDIGAHIGYHTLMARSLVGGEGKVVSFEPTARIFEVLKKNASRYSNISPENSAVTDGKSQCVVLKDFGLSLSSLNTTANGRFENPRSAETLKYTEVPVQATSLDQYVSGRPDLAPDLIKIDAENGEMNVLIGAAGVVEEYRPSIIMEVGDLGRNSVNKTGACFEFLESKGYSFFGYSKKRGISPHQIREVYTKSENYLCIHTSRDLNLP